MTENKRRKPLQARAQATVNAICEACLQILEDPETPPLTTNHAAEKAGVSIGTLYQYFSNLDEILAALGEAQTRKDRARITDIILNNRDVGSLRAIVRTLMNDEDISQPTRQTIADALLRVHGASVMTEHYSAFFDTLEDQASFEFELSREAAFVLTHAPIGLLRAASAQPELGLSPDRLEDELVRMMESYVRALPRVN